MHTERDVVNNEVSLEKEKDSEQKGVVELKGINWESTWEYSPAAIKLKQSSNAPHGRLVGLNHFTLSWPLPHTNGAAQSVDDGCRCLPTEQPDTTMLHTYWT